MVRRRIIVRHSGRWERAQYVDGVEELIIMSSDDICFRTLMRKIHELLETDPISVEYQLSWMSSTNSGRQIKTRLKDDANLLDLLHEQSQEMIVYVVQRGRSSSRVIPDIVPEHREPDREEVHEEAEENVRTDLLESVFTEFTGWIRSTGGTGRLIGMTGGASSSNTRAEDVSERGGSNWLVPLANIDVAGPLSWDEPSAANTDELQKGGGVGPLRGVGPLGGGVGSLGGGVGSLGGGVGPLRGVGSLGGGVGSLGTGVGPLGGVGDLRSRPITSNDVDNTIEPTRMWTGLSTAPLMAPPRALTACRSRRALTAVRSLLRGSRSLIRLIYQTVRRLWSLLLCSTGTPTLWCWVDNVRDPLACPRDHTTGHPRSPVLGYLAAGILIGRLIRNFNVMVFFQKIYLYLNYSEGYGSYVYPSSPSFGISPGETSFTCTQKPSTKAFRRILVGKSEKKKRAIFISHLRDEQGDQFDFRFLCGSARGFDGLDFAVVVELVDGEGVAVEVGGADVSYVVFGRRRSTRRRRRERRN
ncbi:hypothetical protein C2S53_015571 [Perilla frutescens var. hirtella]|uniref:PB1 domain-containing protein n=1 Tax=Perilla frutescens var. hirtella TaxID=608512 RepID=A0AAD4JAF9_PERFH|nr:hypothetical protein C2S53_015571 [Perilla frutescens var. hirtella]